MGDAKRTWKSKIWGLVGKRIQRSLSQYRERQSVFSVSDTVSVITLLDGVQSASDQKAEHTVSVF